MILVLMVLTFLISTLITWHLSRPTATLYIVDKPNERSLHTHPIPVSGGIGILIAFIVASTLSLYWFHMPSTQFFAWVGLCSLLVAVISFIDDCHPVSAFYRLAIHFFAACLLLWQNNWWITQLSLPHGILIKISFLQYGFSLLFIVWMTNLYNFMDVMDGFAGGMTLFGFGTLAILGGLAEQMLFMTMNLLIVCATSGFLLFNFPPARIFMGDVGASTLGFLAATFILWGYHTHVFPLWMALLVFSPFIVDATVTLLKRLLQGEKIWTAHKSHYYQRLVQLGWGHKRTVLWEYVLMFVCSSSAILASYLPAYAQWSLLIGWGGLYCFLIHLVNRLEKKALIEMS